MGTGTRRPNLDALKDLETLFHAGTLGRLTDGQLLGQFLDGHDAAFEALVARHGPMVLRVCRGVLANSHDAQDAFQATFLVLVRRARSIRKRDSLASWLFGVAGRVAARARADAARRRKHERRGAAMTIESTGDRSRDVNDLMPIVHEEVTRLPATYRAAVVLCDLQGQCYEEAARALGCPLGTFKARLSRARARLRDRLARRGLEAPALILPAQRVAGDAARLVKATTRAASTYQAGRATAVATGAVSARVGFLTERMIGSMTLTKLTLIGTTTLALGLSAAGIAVVAAPAGPTSAVEPRNPSALAGPEPLVLTLADAERRALDVARTLPTPAEQAEALLSIGRAQAKRGQAEAARTTLGLAVTAASSIPRNTPYTFPHPIIRVARAQAIAGNPDGARRTFQDAIEIIAAEDDDHQVQNWSNLVRSQLDALGRISQESAAGSLRFEERNRGDVPGLNLPTRLWLQAATGDTRGALHAVAEGAAFADPRWAGVRRTALLAILSVVQPGDPAAAEILAATKQSVRDDPPPPNRNANHQNVLSIAQAEARLGRFADALASARSMKLDGLPAPLVINSRFTQAQRIIEIGTQQAKGGDQHGAVASACEALAIVDTLDDESYQTYPRYQAGELLVEAGDLAKARELATTFKPDYQAFLLEKIGDAARATGANAVALGDLKRALRAAEEFHKSVRDRPIAADKPELRDQQMSSAAIQVVRLQSRLGDIAAALRTVDALVDPSARDNALLVLATSRAQEGDFLAAHNLITRIQTPKQRANAWVAVACVLPAPAHSNAVPKPQPKPQ